MLKISPLCRLKLVLLSYTLDPVEINTDFLITYFGFSVILLSVISTTVEIYSIMQAYTKQVTV